jgi:hypothetical protein
MERICKTCTAPFDPKFANQLNCADCKLKKTVYKQKEREAVKIPDASDYVSPHADTLAKHAAETLAKGRRELPEKKLTMDDSQTVEGIAECLLGLENAWTKKVTLGRNPSVLLLVGNHFLRCSRGNSGRARTPSTASSVINHVRRDVSEVPADGRRLGFEEQTVCQR